MIATSELFAALCRGCVEYPNLRCEAENLAAEANYPLRTEPALPAFVVLGAISSEDALGPICDLLDADD